MRERRHPAHLAPLVVMNRPTIILVTVCIQDRRALLGNETSHKLIRQAWQVADRWWVGRYVVMPDHVHLFCAPADAECSLKQWISYWRNIVTRRWFREEEKPVWQRDYWDTQLRAGENYAEKWEYVRRNPMRAGLVEQPEEWPYAGELHVFRW